MSILPNVLTLARLLMVPVFLYVYFRFPDQRVYAFGVYAAAMLTDALDGWLARALNSVSKFGMLMDPLADKLMTLSAIVCLTISGLLPYPVLLLVAVREIAMIVGGFLAARTGIVISADISGKLATLLFTLSIALMMPWHGNAALSAVGGFLIYPAVALSFYAAIHYAILLVKKTATAKPH
ncbi:MAG: CDP-alcohol phosphatidyltransferase family protein [Christensenellales bacterium]|jgi:cardiolipin synthase